MRIVEPSQADDAQDVADRDDRATEEDADGLDPVVETVSEVTGGLLRR